MHLQLGRFGFDITTRGLVIASVSAAELAVSGASRQVAAALDERPAALMLTHADDDTVAASITMLADQFSGPVGLQAASATLATSAIARGASFVHDPAGLADPAYLRALDAVEAALIVAAPADATDAKTETSFLIERAKWAEAAGIAAERVVLNASPGASAALAALGHHVMADMPADSSAQGAAVLAMHNGVRMISSNQVRATRRTIDTVSELLERRESEGAC